MLGVKEGSLEGRDDTEGASVFPCFDDLTLDLDDDDDDEHFLGRVVSLL